MPRIRGTFLKNWFALSFSDLAGQVLSFFAMFRVARHLAPEGYGVFTLITATASLFALFGFVGLSQVVIVEVAKNKNAGRPTLKAALRVRALSVPLVLAALTFYYLVVKHEASSFVLLLTAVLVTNLNLADLFESVAFGRQVMKYTSVLNLSNSLAWVAGLYLIPLQHLTVEVILLYSVCLQVLRTVLYYLIERRNRFFDVVPDAPHVATRTLLRAGLPYYWMSLVSGALVQLPVILLGTYSGNAEVGLYNAGYRLVMPLSLVLNGMSRVMFPKLVEVRKISPQAFSGLVYSFLSLLVFVGAALALGITAVSREVVLFTVGSAYAAAVPSFVNQIWFLYVYSMLTVIGITLAALEQQRFLAILATIASLASLPFIYFGAHRGATGLSGVVLAFYPLSLAFHFWALEKVLAARMRPLLVLRNAMLILAGFLLSRLLLAIDPLGPRVAMAIAFVLGAVPFYRTDIGVFWNRLTEPQGLAVIKAGQ